MTSCHRVHQDEVFVECVEHCTSVCRRLLCPCLDNVRTVHCSMSSDPRLVHLHSTSELNLLHDTQTITIKINFTWSRGQSFVNVQLQYIINHLLLDKLQDKPADQAINLASKCVTYIDSAFMFEIHIFSPEFMTSNLFDLLKS
jgi:hypothetical protein